MSPRQETPVNLVIGIIIGNIIYFIGILLFASFLGVVPTDIISGPFAESANNLISAWRAIGIILVVADTLLILNFVSSAFGGGRR